VCGLFVCVVCVCVVRVCVCGFRCVVCMVCGLCFV